MKNVLQRFITEKLVQTINKIVDDYVTNLKMPKDINAQQLQVLLDYINYKITQKIFGRDPAKVKKYEEYLA